MWKGQFHTHNTKKYATNSSAANANGDFKTTINQNWTVKTQQQTVRRGLRVVRRPGNEYPPREGLLPAAIFDI